LPQKLEIAASIELAFRGVESRFGIRFCFYPNTPKNGKFTSEQANSRLMPQNAQPNIRLDGLDNICTSGYQNKA
jgi:hypothetical protein